MKVCRVCLAVSVKMYYMLEHKLSVMYERVTGVQINSEDKLPKMICWECVARLSSANNFIVKALKSNWLLMKNINKGKLITMSDIELVNRAQYRLESTLGFKYNEVNNTDLHIQESDITSEDHDASNVKILINKYKDSKLKDFTIKIELSDLTEQPEEADFQVPEPIIIIKNESDEEVTIDNVSNASEMSEEENPVVHKDEEVCGDIKQERKDFNVTPLCYRSNGSPYEKELRVVLEDVMLSLREQKKVTNNYVSELKVSNNNIISMKQPRRKHKNYDDVKKRSLRPSRYPPILAVPLTSTDDSFMDTTDNEKNRDETYVPVTDDTANSSYKSDLSVPLGDLSSCTRDLNFGSILLRLNTNKTHLIEESFVPSQNIVHSNMEQSQCHENVLVPPIESVDRYVTINHTVTSPSISPSQTSRPSMEANNGNRPNSYDSHSSENSEIDVSDQDETNNPASTNSSSNTSYTEEAGDTLTNNNSESRTVRYLRRDTKISQEIISNTDCPEERSTNESGTKMKRIRTKDYCFYCETDVLNFARHIARNHAMECEVQQILSYPKKSCTRKNLLTNLRKRGNYIKNVSKCSKPMKKSSVYSDIDYLPCEKCLGFYSRKLLWKHKKRCQPLSDTANTQVEAQNFMLRNLKVDPKLKEFVFPKMRPDKISLEAKKDPLICAFGAQYLRNHREKYFITVTSRKMRELSKLLIELKKLKSSIKDLMDSLKPQNYDLIVTATKRVSSYNDRTDRYGAPTYTMSISTSLKQCCNIAIMKTLKSESSIETTVIEADLKTLIHLIESNWKFDVSSQANSDLKLKKN